MTSIEIRVVTVFMLFLPGCEPLTVCVIEEPKRFDELAGAQAAEVLGAVMSQSMQEALWLKIKSSIPDDSDSDED